MKRALLAALVVVLVSVGLAGIAASPGSSAAATVDRAAPLPGSNASSLELAGFTDMWMSEQSGRVFVAQGTRRLVVTDESGAHVQTITLGGPVDRVVGSDDGTTAFALRTDAAAVERIDVATGAASELPLVGLPGCLSDFAFAADSLWISYSCSIGRGVAHVDAETGAATEVVQETPIVRVDASTRAPGLVVAQSASGWLYVYDVVGGGEPSAVERASRDAYVEGDVAFTPDGSAVVHGGSGRTYGLNDLHFIAYSDEWGPVALRGDGMFAQASEVLGQVWVHDGLPATNQNLVRSYRWQNTSIGNRGVLFGPERLYLAMLRQGEQWTLRSLVPRPGSSVSVRVPSGYIDYDEVVKVQGRLESEAINQTVEIYLDEVGEDPRRVAVVEASDDGTFSSTFRARRNGRVLVLHPGDEAIDSSHARSADFFVRAAVDQEFAGDFRMVDGVAVYRAGDRAVVKHMVSPKAAGEPLYFDLDVLIDGYWHMLNAPSATLDARSRVTLRLRASNQLVGRTLRIRARFPGSRSVEPNGTGYERFRFVR